MHGVYRSLMPVILLVCVLVTPEYSGAEENNSYRHILVLGLDKPFSAAGVNTPSLVFAYYYTSDEITGYFIQFAVTTTDAGLTVAGKSTKFSAGIKPLYNYAVYGAYSSYMDGINDDSRCFNASNTGIEFFCQYTALKNFSAAAAFYPGYYIYWRKKKSDFFLTQQEATEIRLPENHMEHTGRVDLTLNMLEEKDFNRVKHGLIIQGTSAYSYRRGYGTFYDTAEAEDSSITRTLKNNILSGCYYNFRNDINLMLDIFAAYNISTDRNNADKIGSYAAGKSSMPGYFWGEFYHDRYVTARLQAGFPLFVWGARLKGGFNILYMAEDNKVTGADDYPRRVYRSISAGVSFKAGDILPLFADYAYGMDARRADKDNGTVKKGCHEVIFYALAAF